MHKGRGPRGVLVDEFQFAEGFDAPDRLAFGLAAGPLLAVVGAILTAYALVRSPVPAPVAMPLALFVVGGAVLGLLLIGIHNAWDTVTHVVVADARGDATKKE